MRPIGLQAFRVAAHESTSVTSNIWSSRSKPTALNDSQLEPASRSCLADIRTPSLTPALAKTQGLLNTTIDEDFPFFIRPVAKFRVESEAVIKAAEDDMLKEIDLGRYHAADLRGGAKVDLGDGWGLPRGMKTDSQKSQFTPIEVPSSSPEN
ncbi:MAG: hypothetical protein MMC33_004985 [Icmadophila ericetorum]|nr:hypothetical protein [Icmadophila ericetorum]